MLRDGRLCLWCRSKITPQIFPGPSRTDASCWSSASPNLATSPPMCSALGSCLQDQISGVCPSDPKLEVGGPLPSFPLPVLGSGLTLQTFREVHGLHKLFSNIKGVQATQLLLPEELPPDRQM